MLDKFEADNFNDDNGNPAGGFVNGVGLSITWQEGPLGRGEDRKEPNGAFVETVIAAAKQRLEYYQDSKFSCEENEQAIFHLTAALNVLNARTQAREQREVEGTHEV